MWCFDTEGRHIKFNEDGTGELWCRCNFNYWIAAEFKWRRIESSCNQTEIPRTLRQARENNNAKLLGQLDLDMTLSKQLPKWTEGSTLKTSTMVNEHSLTDDAFRPKSYAVRIEKGNFVEPSSIGFLPNSDKPRFAIRLLFDKSPYPPRSEWKTPDGGPDTGEFWDHVEFVSRCSPDLLKEGKAMNELTTGGWYECIVV